MRLFAIACVALGCTESTTRPEPFREGIELSTARSGAPATQFNFSRERELWVRVRVAALTGTTSLRLTFTTPAGETHYESMVAYSPDPAVQTKEIPGAPHPVTVFPAQPVGGGYVLEYVVPVAGSALSRFPAPGRWRVDAAVQGGKTFSVPIDVTY